MFRTEVTPIFLIFCPFPGGRGHLGGQIGHSKCVSRKGVIEHSFLTKTVSLDFYCFTAVATGDNGCLLFFSILVKLHISKVLWLKFGGVA